MAFLLAGLGGIPAPLDAQSSTNAPEVIPDPTALNAPAIPPAPRALPVELPATQPTAASPMSATASVLPHPLEADSVLAAQGENSESLPTFAAILMVFSLGGFLLYQCGLTRARNCGHTSMVVLVGAVFALVGYWAGGFAVQTGGVGDAHAALPRSVALPQQGALDHELGFVAGGHHWGLMGNAGFFLVSDNATREGMAALFLVQFVFVLFAVGAMLGAALERARLVAVAVLSFLAGAAIFPLVANWIWGGGWLAELGREFGLGHGVVDLAGAGVVHEAAGAMALALACVLGARSGRFDRYQATGIPGHNVPFSILGSLLVLSALLASNALAGDLDVTGVEAGPAVANVLLGAAGGVLASILLGAGRRQQATPARLSRGLIGGAVAICGGSAFYDSWAAFIIGACAGCLVEFIVRWLARRGIDDPVNVTAVHGAAGAWGLLAVGLFANGSGGRGLNSVGMPVRGLFFGGSWHQLAAQGIGCADVFVVAFGLAFLALQAMRKIMGIRVKMAEELQGLDWTQVGAFGYQPDIDSAEEERLS